ncbi:NUDIX domain-containing protein [Streptomyces sp. NPDC058254]|uniref:NUDIX domain-containing protein n=1 Tax=Streptomyces sp. NPDC058254 TaxID=3346406 RepID=UPI0036EC9846
MPPTDTRLPVIAFSGLIFENEHGFILFQRTANTGFADGTLALPGGRLQEEEQFGDAARREAKEELGVIVEDLEEVYAFNKLDEGVLVIG